MAEHEGDRWSGRILVVRLELDTVGCGVFSTSLLASRYSSNRALATASGTCGTVGVPLIHSSGSRDTRVMWEMLLNEFPSGRPTSTADGSSGFPSGRNKSTTNSTATFHRYTYFFQDKRNCAKFVKKLCKVCEKQWEGGSSTETKCQFTIARELSRAESEGMF